MHIVLVLQGVLIYHHVVCTVYALKKGLMLPPGSFLKGPMQGASSLPQVVRSCAKLQYGFAVVHFLEHLINNT